MDYRYDLHASASSSNNHQQQQQQYLTSTLYSAYNNSNEVQLYNYGSNGVAEAATASGSNHSAPGNTDLYNPYYETDNMAAAYPSSSLRHYTNLTEGEFYYKYHFSLKMEYQLLQLSVWPTISKAMKWKVPEAICTVAVKIRRKVIND